MEYYIHYECPKCEGDVYEKGLNLVEHNGRPVFSLDQFSCYSMTCDNDVYRKDGDDSVDAISPDEWNALPESEKEDWYLTRCEYSFGTGDIEVVGEDDL